MSRTSTPAPASASKIAEVTPGRSLPVRVTSSVFGSSSIGEEASPAVPSPVTESAQRSDVRGYCGHTSGEHAATTARRAKERQLTIAEARANHAPIDWTTVVPPRPSFPRGRQRPQCPPAPSVRSKSQAGRSKPGGSVQARACACMRADTEPSVRKPARRRGRRRKRSRGSERCRGVALQDISSGVMAIDHPQRAGGVRDRHLYVLVVGARWDLCTAVRRVRASSGSRS